MILFMSIAVATAAALGLSSNIFVIILRFIKRRSCTTFQMLLGALALNDVILSILFAFLSPIMYKNYTWIFPVFTCKMLFPFITIASSANVGTILLISYERYRAIRYPFRPRFTYRRTAAALLVVWIVSILFTVPNIIALDVGKYDVCGEHWSNSTSPKIYSAVLLAFIYIIPLIVIATFHIIIVYQLKTANRSRLKSTNKNLRSDANAIRRRSRNVKIMKLLAIISIAFAVCILPTKIQYVIGDFAPDLFTDDVYDALHIYQVLFYFHVVMNPIFYSLADKQFRRDAMQLLCCKLREVENSSFRVTN